MFGRPVRLLGDGLLFQLCWIRFYSRKVTIWASTGAAILGENPFSSRNQVKIKCWKKMDSNSYCLALERMHASPFLKSMEQKANDLQVFQDAQKATTSQEVLNVQDEVRNLQEASSLASDPSVPIEDLIVKAKTVPSLSKNVNGVLVQQQRVFEKKSTYSIALEEAESIKRDPSATEEQIWKAEESVAQAQEDLEQTSRQCDLIQKDFLQDLQRRKFREEETSELLGQAAGSFGNHVERTEVQTQNIQNNAFFYYKTISENVLLGCKVDGIQGDRVVELKARQRKMFFNVPRYEWIQCQLMMKITGLKLCSHTEMYQQQKHTTDITFDSGWVSSVALPDFEIFSKEVRQLLEIEKLQDELIAETHALAQ